MKKQGISRLSTIRGKVFSGLNSELAEKDKNFKVAMEILEQALDEIDQRGLCEED